MINAVKNAPQELSEILDSGSQALALALSTNQRHSLLAYVQLLHKWNAVYNLTAIRDPQQMLVQHILDSLAIVPTMQRLLAAHAGAMQRRVLDVGSGGGLPGIPLAIAIPDVHVTMIDPVHKKTAFLAQAKAELQLNNVQVLTGKVEALADAESNAPYAVITSRAFSSLSDFVQLAQAQLLPAGRFVAMKGQVPQAEIAALSETFVVEEVVSLSVPGLDAERCLVLIKQQ